MESYDIQQILLTAPGNLWMGYLPIFFVLGALPETLFTEPLPSQTWATWGHLGSKASFVDFWSPKRSATGVYGEG